MIYDANNGTRKARHSLAEKFDKEGIHVVMLGEWLSHLPRSTSLEIRFIQKLSVITKRS